MVDLYAIAIDDVRDMFGADDALAAELTDAARAAFPEPVRHRRAFLPLTRRAPEFAVDPARPTKPDLDVLLSGGYVAPERMGASWTLLRALLEHRAAAHGHLDAGPARLDAVEFELSCKGLDSFYSLRSLAERALAIPLISRPDHLDGYAKHVHVAETLEAWREVLPRVSDGTRALVVPVVEVCEVAAAERLDVVLLTS